MKILIVDDEHLTREGLISTVNWKLLGIGEVLQADDGVHALELAKIHSPEIILSDVRMPRMDGIRLADMLTVLLPDSSIIFMSGYSDKEYLKAAIKLKAISYVEKPLDTLEIENAVAEAIRQNQKIHQTKKAADVSASASVTTLVHQLCYPWHYRENESPDFIASFPYPISSSTSFTAMIIKFVNVKDEMPGTDLQKLSQDFQLYIKTQGFHTIYAPKHGQYMIYYIFGESKPTAKQLQSIAAYMQSRIRNHPFFIALGIPQNGISNAFESYASAVVLLQSSFFYDYGSILSVQTKDSVPAPILSDPTAAFEEIFSARQEPEILEMVDKIYHSYQNAQNILPNKIRDIYYKLFTVLQDSCHQSHLNLTENLFETDSILTLLEQCHTLTELHQMLQDKIDTYFRIAESSVPENSTIFLIKEFIHHNYTNSNLSAKEISSHVYLSTSYVCTLFKSETNKTLNQYITEYRIEKAKKLLSDPRNKITDVSAKVGYTDGNYFGKSFKKIVGLSPSEYREKTMQ